MDELARWFSALNDARGINLTVAYDRFDRLRFLNGFLVTLQLSAATIATSVALGVAGAWLVQSRSRIVRGLVRGLVEFFRNTPPLVQLYFFYFGLSSLISVAGPSGAPAPAIGNFAWAVLALSLFAGAHNVEIFRAGIEAVQRTTVEAAESLGYGRLSAYRNVILPLALRVCLPALSNNLVNLVKTTSIAYAVAVPEMHYVANQIWSDALNVPEMMLLLLACYLLLVGGLVAGMTRLERALRVPGFGA